MALFPFVGLLLASCAGQTAAMTRSGWQEPNAVTEPPSVTTNPALDERQFSAAVIANKLDTIYLSGDPRRRVTANFGLDFRIGNGLWAPCPTTILNVDACLVGSCFDENLCSTGCGFLDRTSLSTISCTGRQPLCSTAILTHQTAVQPVTNYACADIDHQIHYMGFTTDTLPEEFETTSSTTSSASTSTGPGQGVFRASTESSDSTITEPPSTSSTPGPAANASGQSESGSTTNMGAIIGGAIGGLAVLCGFIVAVVWLLRRNKKPDAKSLSAASSTLHEGDMGPAYGKPELEAYERERAELFGQGLPEMSARGPAAYDSAHYRPNYPPMTPVELPVAHSSWKPTRV